MRFWERSWLGGVVFGVRRELELNCRIDRGVNEDWGRGDGGCGRLVVRKREIRRVSVWTGY